LNRFKEEFKIRERKFELYGGGEELFALPRTEYADLEKTKKELKLSDQV
jgi:dynein heavy chain, axonemal